MFIDFLTLLLVNMTAGYVLLALYIHKGLHDPQQNSWGLGFSATGIVALVFGSYILFTWPLPGAYNSAYGETSALLGTIFLAAGVGMIKRWDLRAIAGYAFFPGVAAVVLGLRIIDLDMTKAPLLSGVGFILSGLGGICALPVLAYFKENQNVRLVGTIVMLAAAAIWAATAYPGLWGHMESFAKWVPPMMRTVAGP